MRTSKHIDSRALCSSSHVLQAVVYMLMLDTLTPARPTHSLLCCWSRTAGFILILTPFQFDKNVRCDFLMSRATVRSPYLLNLAYQQRSVDYKMYFTVASREPQARNRISFRFAVSIYPEVTELSAVKISNLFSIEPPHLF